MVLLYSLPIVASYIIEPTSFWIIASCYVLSGIGMIGIGMGVMHDANHGSYSSNKKHNKFFGGLIWIIGASPLSWKIQHNTLHHTFTNVEGYDEDIDVPLVLRFSPHGKKLWIHKFQAFYFWLLYGLTTLIWVTVKDFFSIARYRKMGYIKSGKEVTKEATKLVIWKLIYFTYMLVVPIYLRPDFAMEIVGAFLIMHFISGLILSLVFQAAHVMTDIAFPLPDENQEVDNNWLVHQLQTTTNFAPKNKVLSWFIGGLNFQVEHHLFPNISHVHYPKLSKVIRETVEEFGFEYQLRSSFTQAILDHVKMLHRLGRMEAIELPSLATPNIKLSVQ